MLVHRTRDHTVIFTAWLCLFTILLEIVARNTQCFESLSMFVLLFFKIERVIGEVSRIDICSMIELQVHRSMRNIEAYRIVLCMVNTDLGEVLLSFVGIDRERLFD